MPQERPDSLGDETYTDLIAFLLQENGIEAGPEPAAGRPDGPRGALDGLAIRRRRTLGRHRPAARAGPRRNPLDGIRPVTDAMLEQPDPENWLLWRRTYDAAGYSPLQQITSANVDGLRRRVVVVAAARSRANPRPIVHDGVLFVHGFGDKVHALDAASGDLLWEYARRLPRDVAPSLKRGMSIYGERLYLPTSDLHVVALDVKHRRCRVGDSRWSEHGERVRLTGGTLVARGTVMVGTTGRAGGGNFIVGLDAETGASSAGGSTPFRRPTRRAATPGTDWRIRGSQRRLGLDSGQLRPGAQPGVLRSGQHVRYGTAA